MGMICNGGFHEGNFMGISQQLHVGEAVGLDRFGSSLRSLADGNLGDDGRLDSHFIPIIMDLPKLDTWDI